MPAIGPPWTELVAYDLNEGTIKWRTPLGTIPGLAAQGIKNTGSVRPRGGPVVTAGGLIIVGSGGDGYVHAFDKDTGKDPLGNRRSKGTLTEFRRCTRLTAVNTWPFTRPAAAGTESSTRATKPEAQGYYVFALPNSDSKSDRRNKMELSMRALVLTVGLSMFPESDQSHGAGKYLKVEYPASTAADQLQIAVTYTMWVPDDVARFRCVIVHQHGAGRNAAEHGATAAYDLHWQALAKKWDCALLGPYYRVLTDATDATPGGSELWFDPRRGSDKAFLKALGELAAQANHPELATVPWALWGHSGGGIWSDVMTTLYPDRVAAVFLRSGSFRNRPNFPQPETPAAAYAVPVMGNAGVKEQDRGAWINTLARISRISQQGRPGRICPRSTHGPRDRRLALSGDSFL